MDKYYIGIDKFKNDNVISRLILEVTNRLIDVNTFTQNLPITTPLHKKGHTYYSLFDKTTIYYLLINCLYSVIKEYIVCSDDPNLLRADIEEFKQIRREKIKENAIISNQVESHFDSLDEEFHDIADDLQDMQIVTGNKEELKQRVCEVLLAFIEIEEKNKKSIDFSYENIIQRVRRSKDKEKHSMFEYLNKMSIEERRVENMMKNFKIGKWNVGMQKGLVQYDSAINERETNDLIGHLMQDMKSGTMDVVSEMMIDFYDLDEVQDNEQTEGQMVDVNELEQQQENETDEFYNDEAYGINELSENYADGEYYEEDRDEDFGYD
jgi:hypothetical protein